MFAKIIDRMEFKAGKTKDKLEVWKFKEGNYNPEDCPIEAVFKKAMEQLDVAYRKNRILVEEVRVL